MTPSPISPEPGPLLAFGAHPDDIEFGCGGVVALETRTGRRAHLVVCSRGEAGSNGSPEVRTREAETAAGLLHATLEFVEFDGDGRLDDRAEHAIAIARIIRRVRPAIVFAPCPTENQHPDHCRLGRLVQRAVRLARYGGLTDLAAASSHAIDHLLFYAVTPDAEPKDVMPVYFDVSDEQILIAWKSAMRAHVSQLATRDYVELQLGRARLNGQRAGVGHAMALYPNDPILIRSLSQLGRGARNF